MSNTDAALKAAREALAGLLRILRGPSTVDGCVCLHVKIADLNEIGRIVASIDSALASGEPATPQDEVEAVAKAAAKRLRYVWDGLPDATGPDFPCVWKQTNYGSIENISKSAFRDLAKDCIDAHRSARQTIPSGRAEEFERLVNAWSEAISGEDEEHALCDFVGQHRVAIRDALRAARKAAAESQFERRVAANIIEGKREP